LVRLPTRVGLRSITAKILGSRQAKRSRFGGPIERGSLIAVEVQQNHTVMKTKFAFDQIKEFAPRTLKEIVHGRAKTLRFRASVKSEWSALSRLKVSPEEKRATSS
jgi:hypothetical protein